MDKESEKKQLREKLSHLNAGIDYIRGIIAAEQAVHKPDEPVSTDELKGLIAQSDSRLADFSRQIEQQKEKINKRKSSINAKKLAYESLQDDQKKDGWVLLTEDVNKDHLAIGEGQSAIGILEKGKFAEFQYNEQLQQKLKALDVVAFHPEDDPRLKAVLAERKQTEQQLEALQEKL